MVCNTSPGLSGCRSSALVVLMCCALAASFPLLLLPYRAETGQLLPALRYTHACDPTGVEALLLAGANPNFVNEEGMTALDIALHLASCDGVQALLIEAGARSASAL